MAKTAAKATAGKSIKQIQVKCPECSSELKLVQVVPGGMHYICEKGDFAIPVTKRVFKSLPHEVVG